MGGMYMLCDLFNNMSGILVIISSLPASYKPGLYTYESDMYNYHTITL